jgi:uncharacterized alpha-E superfamily protein
MLSRVANSIYWMSRYIERAESVARFIDVNLRLLLDLPSGAAEQWEPLVSTTGDRETFYAKYKDATRGHVTDFLSFDTGNPNSIKSCVRAARENARGIRKVISTEMWESLNQFCLVVNDVRARNAAREDPYAFYTAVRHASHAFVGTASATMSHGEGWHFARLGRYLERGDQTSRILDVKYFILLPDVADVGTPLDDIQWAAVLRSASAFEMYRKRHGRIAPNRIVDFLLLDREFPRAVHHCLMEAEGSLRAVTGAPINSFRNPAEQRLGQLRSEFAYAQVDDIIHAGLHEFIDGLQTKLNGVGDAIAEMCFAPPPAAPMPVGAGAAE